MKEYNHIYTNYSEIEKREIEEVRLLREISKSLKEMLLLLSANHPAGTG